MYPNQLRIFFQNAILRYKYSTQLIVQWIATTIDIVSANLELVLSSFWRSEMKIQANIKTMIGG